MQLNLGLFGFIWVGTGNDKLQFKIFFKVLGLRVWSPRLPKNGQKRLVWGFRSPFSQKLREGQLLSPYSCSACENLSKILSYCPLAQPLYISVISDVTCYSRVVQKCIAKNFLLLNLNDPLKSFQNPEKVVTYFSFF